MISIITPVHKIGSLYLEDSFRQIVKQTYRGDWEWLIGLNNGGSVPGYIERNDHVRVITLKDELENGRNKIGRLKRSLASDAEGDILVELDADDMLTVDALAEIAESFKDPSIHMVYSNSAEFREGSWESHTYSEYWGWRSRNFTFKSHQLKEMIAWPPSPQMMRRIEWSPNHVRAWRTSSYFTVGGHDEMMPTADDHDLNCRFYLEYGAAGFRHIDRCLYLYRVHGENTCIVENEEVQSLTLRNYYKYVQPMAVRWAKDEWLERLDLGGGIDGFPDFKTVDFTDGDISCDLNQPWPIESNSVGVLRASHIFEHLKDPIHVMNEAYRVLAPGGFLFVEVPSTDGRGAYQDPTHVSFWNSNSFWYYTNREKARFIPSYTGRFQVGRIENYYPTDFERLHNIVIVRAELIALKPPYDTRPVGEVLL